MERTTRTDLGLQLPTWSPADRAVQGLLAYLQGIFTQGYPKLRWHEDPEHTDIMILESEETDPGKLRKLPAILVSDTECNWILPGLGKAKVQYADYDVLVNQVTFGMNVRVIAEEGDIVGLSWAVFSLIPIYRDLLERKSGIILFGNPRMVRGKTRNSRDGLDYPLRQIVCTGAASVAFRRSWAPADNILDAAVKKATMVLEVGATRVEAGTAGVNPLAQDPALLDQIVQRSLLGSNRFIFPATPMSDEPPLTVQRKVDV